MTNSKQNSNKENRVAFAVGLVHVPGDMRLGVVDADPRSDTRA